MRLLLVLALLGLLPVTARTQEPPGPQEVDLQPATEPPPPRQPPVRFRVQALPDLRSPGCDLGEQGVAVNARGEVVGTICRGDLSRAAAWTGEGELQLVDTTEEGPHSFAVDLDDEGTVLGYVLRPDGPLSFLWSADTSPIWLALPEGAIPLALGADRQVAFCYRPGDWLVGAILDDEGQPIDIAGGERDVLVRDVNAAGEVTGIVGGEAAPARAFRWSVGSGLVELAVPDGFTHAHGNAITDAGLVVGLSRTEERDRATVWSPEGEPRLLPYVDDEHTQSGALGVNADGWIVGYEHAEPWSFGRARAVLWIDGVAWELDRLLVEQHGGEVHVTVAWDVNEAGQIAARGTLDGVQRALRLDPE